MVVINRHLRSGHQIFLIRRYVQFFPRNAFVLRVIVNLHRVARRASPSIHIKNRKRIHTINACNTIKIRSQCSAVWSRCVSQGSFGRVIHCSRVRFKPTLPLNIASDVLIVNTCFIWRGYTSSRLDIKFVGTRNPNYPIIERLLCRTHFVIFTCFV